MKIYLIHKQILILCLVQFLCINALFSQKKISRQEYIDLYKDIAINEMIKFGVPASITLAQGIHESNNGNSLLTKNANNHFGIKCHKSWQGEKVFMDDDEKGECFRKYKNASESFRDHSEFLRKNQRYSALFELEITDYKSWAKGLKAAGYATNSKYADLIISTIENNKLYEYDLGIIPEVYNPEVVSKCKDKKSYVFFTKSGRTVFVRNKTNYVFVKKGDSFFKLSDVFDLTIKFLNKCNDFPDEYNLKEGEILYLEKKRNRAQRGYDKHIVEQGETLHSISQLYAVKVKKIYKKNHLKSGDEVQLGDTLWLRKTKPMKKD